MTGRLFLFLDYDGTLTPIKSSPDRAVISPAMRRLLKNLAGTPGIEVAIVTGRMLSDIKSIIGLPALTYAGNHGLEIAGPGIKLAVMSGTGFEHVISRIHMHLKDTLASVKGVLIENKGVTLSLHYRQVPARMLPGVMSVFTRIINPYLENKLAVVRPGNNVLEVWPAVPWDKGRAVRWILKQRTRIHDRIFPIYIGDDRTDESAFIELARRGLTLAVGTSGSTQARYRIRGPRQVAAFLGKIKEVYGARH